jgi:hypothetical protein
MTRTTNARIAGFTYLFYIAVALPGMLLFDRASGTEGMAAKLALIAVHTSDVHMSVMLSMLSSITALALAVALYGLTRDEDHELAVLALSCRVGEGVLGSISIIAALGLLWLATATGTGAPEPATAYTLGAFLLKVKIWNLTIAATFFAAGSALFSYLLLRGRMVPLALARLGVLASVLLVAGLPLQLVGFFSGAFAGLIWLPMLVFEVTIALWFLIKGVAKREERISA